MTQRQRDLLQTWIEVAMRVAIPLLLGVAGWTASHLLDHDRRLSVIEATRYTAADARREQVEMRAEMRSEIEQIRQLVATNTALLQRIDERVQALQRAPK